MLTKAEQMELLRRSVSEWNAWRRENEDAEIELRGANLRGAYLRGANLRDAYLSGANLRGANLRDADLPDAYLSGANLAGANLRDAYLSGANLVGANLSGANLRGANLRHTNLSGANLSGAYLRGANLRGANLRGANLSGANLADADLVRAYLAKTVLDPANAPNSNVDGFKCDGDYVLGWRTARSTCCGNMQYEPGQEYIAPVFSTSDDACHPGLYVWPTREAALDWGEKYNCSEVVQVRFLAADVHHAGDKWRVKRFTVKEDESDECR